MYSTDLTKYCPICNSSNIKELEEFLRGSVFITKYVCLDCVQLDIKSNTMIHTSIWEVDENGNIIF